MCLCQERCHFTGAASTRSRQAQQEPGFKAAHHWNWSPKFKLALTTTISGHFLVPWVDMSSCLGNVSTRSQLCYYLCPCWEYVASMCFSCVGMWWKSLKRLLIIVNWPKLCPAQLGWVHWSLLCFHGCGCCSFSSLLILFKLKSPQKRSKIKWVGMFLFSLSIKFKLLFGWTACLCCPNSRRRSIVSPALFVFRSCVNISAGELPADPLLFL